MDHYSLGKQELNFDLVRQKVKVSDCVLNRCKGKVASRPEPNRKKEKTRKEIKGERERKNEIKRTKTSNT
ncbi:hypothetical protein BLOT_004289 [Blomia tropicalis]|nr:hypothetical protein BLOT_004289 [Blomia tropicalis]